MTNHKAIQKHYHRLAPRERLALIVAAIARGDDAERETLIDSAPMLTYRMPDYHSEADAFNYACLYHIAKQLDIALLLAIFSHAEAESKTENARFSDASKLGAYALCTRAAAWRVFCEGLGIDADAALKGLPGADSLAMGEELARVWAFTPEEARTAFEERAVRLQLSGELATVDSAAAEMRAAFEHWVKIL